VDLMLMRNYGICWNKDGQILKANADREKRSKEKDYY
jgi:hypothetical protein